MKITCTYRIQNVIRWFQIAGNGPLNMVQSSANLQNCFMYYFRAALSLELNEVIKFAFINIIIHTLLVCSVVQVVSKELIVARLDSI